MKISRRSFTALSKKTVFGDLYRKKANGLTDCDGLENDKKIKYQTPKYRKGYYIIY